MTNSELLLLAGLGVFAAGLAVAIPPWPTRPVWLTTVLGVVAAVLGALVFLVVLLR